MKIAATISRYLLGLLFSVFWTEWVPPFHPRAAPGQSGGSAFVCLGIYFALHGIDLSSAIHQWRIAAGGSSCASRTCDLRTGPGQYPELPHHNGSGWHRPKVIRDHSLDNRLPSLSVQLRPYFSAAAA